MFTLWKCAHIESLPEDAMTYSTYIGATMRFVRKHRRCSPETLARHLGIGETHLIDIEEGRQNPSEALEGKILYWLHGQDGADRIVRGLIRSVYTSDDSQAFQA